jgi:hypothetical protein
MAYRKSTLENRVAEGTSDSNRLGPHSELYRVPGPPRKVRYQSTVS